MYKLPEIEMVGVRLNRVIVHNS